MSLASARQYKKTIEFLELVLGAIAKLVVAMSKGHDTWLESLLQLENRSSKK